MSDTKLTSVKIISELYNKFKIEAMKLPYKNQLIGQLIFMLKMMILEIKYMEELQKIKIDFRGYYVKKENFVTQ